MTTRLRSGQVAEAAGVNLQTLRYYERRGLLAEPERSLGGHRLYPEQAVTIVRIIRASQRLGFTLDDVAELLETGRHRHGRGPDAGLHAKAVTKLAEIEQRIADLQVIADTLRVAARCRLRRRDGLRRECGLPAAVRRSWRTTPRALVTNYVRSADCRPDAVAAIARICAVDEIRCLIRPAVN